MSDKEYELTIPDDHWLELASIDDFEAFLKYYKISFKSSDDKKLYQTYILKAAADDRDTQNPLPPDILSTRIKFTQVLLNFALYTVVFHHLTTMSPYQSCKL